MIRLAALIAGLALLAAPALGVGLGPLAKSGITDGPRKAFYLTLINPYPAAARFSAYAVGTADEAMQTRVSILPADATVAGRGSRRLLVIAEDMAPGETYDFRVCAARADLPEGMIHARVCSRLSARRIAR